MTRPRLTTPALLAAGTLLLAACGTPAAQPSASATDASATTATTARTPSPVATATAAPPTVASPGATRPPAPTASAWLPASDKPVTLVGGLKNPWSIVFLPDGTALFTQRESTSIWHVDLPGQGKPEQVTAVEDARPSGEGGLLGLALSPQFAADKQVYLYYTAQSDNRVARGTWDGTKVVDLTPVVVGIPKGSNHNGGRIAFGPDGKLYIGAGDAGEKSRSQDRSTLAGKILRVNPDGSVPPDNPEPGKAWWSYGHRNVQGLAWTADGTMIASEFGQDTVDELNVIVKGKNYGWPDVEGTGGAARGYVDPVVTWTPTSECSPSGIAFDTAKENLYVSCLRGQRIYRVPFDGNAPGTPEILTRELGRVRLTTPGPDGRLVVLTSNYGNPPDRIVLLPQR